MSVALIQTALITGEVSSSLFGHVDLARMHSAASTMRNLFVSYRGGAYSRAGTKFVGFSKQTGRSVPPRLVTFQFNINQGLALEFGNQYMRVISNGAFVTEGPIAITNITQANPGVMTTASDAFVTGDWVFLASVAGMSEVNGQTYVLVRTGASTYTLHDVYGNNINTTGFTAYTAGGTASRIYTLTTIYNEADLAYLKFTQSADVMSICCVNQITHTEYAPQDLSRITDSNWLFTPAVPAPTVTPPTVNTITGNGTGAVTTYDYQITSVSPTDGTESVASAELKLSGTVNIAAAAGTITLRWTPLAGVNEYNVYKATPGYASADIPDAVLFGYVGTSYGNEFIDSNIVPDFTQVPPLHRNPFARGQITGLTITAPGAGYTVIGTTITTATGSGAIIQLITTGGTLVAAVIKDPGHDYAPGDTVTITGDGAGATATLLIGPQTGTYPSVPAYFQQRRAYANSLNDPDTYWMSQPGSYTNFDIRVPPVDSDAITGTPWALQVNGIQFMLPMPGGLVVLTGLSAWQVSGAGGSTLAAGTITPASQQAQPQAYNGCSSTVPPIRIDQDIVYVQAKGSIYRALSYQLYQNIYTGTDLTLNSSHLFTNFTIRDHAWCEEPYKLLWAVRDDGTLLSFTYLKPQEVAAWGRSDTQGYFESVCSVTEPPVDALYTAVQRLPGGRTGYMIERMDNRLWSSAEDCWCVDSGLSLAQPTPNGALQPSSATGLGAISGVTGLVGGTGYSAGTTAIVVDDNGAGPGVGAVIALTIVGGAITVAAVSVAGTGYVNPKLVIQDPANSGAGASATLTLNNSATFLVGGAYTWAVGDVGSVIRVGGGIALITVRTDATHVTANILSPILATIPNGGSALPVFLPGDWTLTKPIGTVGGLTHLVGATVTGLADGNVITPRVVSAAGTIALDALASAVIVGLGFQAQLQSVYLDAGAPTLQGQRKKVGAVTARIEASRGLKAGGNQPDGSTQNPMALAPTWRNLADVPDDGPNFPRKPYNALATPLRTGDIRVTVSGGFGTPGQVAIQQDNPLPMQVLAIIPEFLPGDTTQLEAEKRRPRSGAEG